MHRATRVIISVIISVLIGIIYGWASGSYALTFDRGGGDIGWAMCAARALAAGEAPYSDCPSLGSQGQPMPMNPLTTAIVVAPLAGLPGHIAAGIFIGISAALLAWGLLGTGKTWRLLVLLSFPAIACLQLANWTILLLAGLYVPGLAVLAVAKPHAAIPVFLARAWQYPRMYLLPAAAIIWFSFVLRPAWPLEFLGAIGGYTGGPTVLRLPFGPLLLLAIYPLWRWRQGSALWLLLCAVVPLRPYYDWLLLAPIFFGAYRWLMAWVVLSWLPFFLRVPLTFDFVAMPLIWYPALAAVLLDRERIPWQDWLAQLRSQDPRTDQPQASEPLRQPQHS